MHQLNNTLKYLATITSVAVVALGIYTLSSEPVTPWGGSSMAASLLLLVAAVIAAWKYANSFFSHVAFLYGAVLVGRLFSTLRLPADMVARGGTSLDPLLLGETGPGIESIMYLSYLLVALIVVQLFRLALRWRVAEADVLVLSTNDWVLSAVRVYVGLMFIAHYSGHVLAGPDQFQIFADYFAGVGFHIGGPLVVLAGLIEIAVSIGLVFGLMTRSAAVGGALYLFFATLWGDHFSAGYIWILPGGGWEFSALWIFTVLVFAVTGGGRISLDDRLKPVVPNSFNWAFR